MSVAVRQALSILGAYLVRPRWTKRRDSRGNGGEPDPDFDYESEEIDEEFEEDDFCEHFPRS